MIPVLFPFWFAAAFVLSLALFRGLGYRWLHRGEEAFFAAVTALGLMGTATVTLGLFGLATAASLRVAAAATGAAALALRWRTRGMATAPPVPSPAGYLVLAASLLLLPFLFLPPFFYDTLRYHYGLPALYLRTGLTWPLPRFVESHFPLGGEMLSLIGMADGGVLGANLVNLLVLVLGGLGILALADRLGSRRAGQAAAILFMTSSTALHMLFIQKPDLAVALFFFAGAYALLAWLEAGGERRVLLLAAGLMGFFLGTKYTAPLFAGAAFAVAGAERIRRDRLAGAAVLREGLLFAGAALVPFLPWLCRNLAATGNPVYPLLNGVFGNVAWSPERMRILAADSNAVGSVLSGWRDVLRLLRSMTFFPDLGISGTGASMGASILGAALFPWLVRAPAPPWRFVRNLALALAAVWLLSAWLSRFLLPALPFMALMSGFLVARAAGKGGWGKAAATLTLVLAVLAQGTSAAAESSIFRAWRGAFALVGHPERRAVIAARFDPSRQAAVYAHRQLPADSKTLFVGETRIYAFRRDFDAPSAYDDHPIREAVGGRGPEEARRFLASRGYSHLLVNWGEWDRLGRQYYARLWRQEEIAGADRLIRSLPAVYRDERVAILSLQNTPGATPPPATGAARPPDASPRGNAPRGGL